MGWERRPRGHECPAPAEQPLLGRRVRTGDIWRCPRCGTRWAVRVVTDPRGRYRFEWDLARQRPGKDT